MAGGRETMGENTAHWIIVDAVEGTKWTALKCILKPQKIYFKSKLKRVLVV